MVEGSIIFLEILAIWVYYKVLIEVNLRIRTVENMR